MYGYGLDVLHLDDTHLKQQSGASLAPQSVKDPHSPLLAWSIEGALEDCEILAIPPDYLALLTGSILPKECP